MRYLLSALLFLSQIATAQTPLDISIDSVRFHVDTTHQLVLCQADLTRQAILTDSTSVRLIVGNTTYSLRGKHTELRYQDSYSVPLRGSNYPLYFTKLPVITIQTQDSIRDTTKVDGQFTYVTNDDVLNSFIGIETRGGVSQYFPKKTYDIELREDTITEQSRDLQFGNLRKDDDWILDALYNEPLRIRSFMTHKLWLAMHQPTYQDEEPEAKAGADVMWVEVFLHGAYQGIYALSEQVDRKLLKLKKFKEGEVRGELFKAEGWSDAVLLREAPPFVATSRKWESYQMKYPTLEDATDWTNLHSFVSFVADADSSLFVETIDRQFDLSNALDYFMLMNAVRAGDNYGKNIYIARYNQKTPYFYVPWDLDATWGQRWDGAVENITDDILYNGLYQRLIRLNAQTFNERLTLRWNELRNSILSDANVMNLIDETHRALLDNNIYEREQLVWKEYTYDPTSTSYLKSWTQRRFAYLDEYFYDPVLSVDEPEKEERVDLYPNPASGYFKVNLPHHRPMAYQLINAYGAVVRTVIISPNDATVDVATLPQGYYVFRTENIVKRILITD